MSAPKNYRYQAIRYADGSTNGGWGNLGDSIITMFNNYADLRGYNDLGGFVGTLEFQTEGGKYAEFGPDVAYLTLVGSGDVVGEVRRKQIE